MANEFVNLFQESRLLVSFLGLLVVLLAALEISFRVGRRRQKGGCPTEDSEIGVIQGGTLGLLALLLAFTLAMAVSRYDSRKQLVVDEANAIGTAYLRTQLLATPEREEMQELLRRYVDLRLVHYETHIDVGLARSAARQAEDLQDRIWTLAAATAAKDPRAVTTGLLLASLNEVIDIHARQLASHLNRVPRTVIWLLLIVSLVAMAIIGYGCGMAKSRHFISTSMLAVLVAAVLFVIVDLDSPGEGLIQISQQSMLNLRESFNKAAPPAADVGAAAPHDGDSAKEKP